MAALSAAELQRRHELEGAPDPFPSLSAAPSRSQRPGPVTNGNIDTADATAFPSLAPAATPKPAAAAAWGAGPRVQASPTAKSSTVTQTVTIPSIDLSQLTRDKSFNKPANLLEYQKAVGSKYRVQITSTQHRTLGHTTFTIKADSDKDIAKARKHLLLNLSATVTLKVEAPNSTLPSIIGPGGSTIKAIRDKTTARIDVPRRDESPADADRENNDEDEEPTTTITVSAPEPLAHEAKVMIEDIISQKKSKSSQKVRDVPAHILPFILPRKAEFLSASQGLGEVNVTLDKPSSTIIIAGDRTAVKAVAEKIQEAVETLKSSLVPLKMSLPKKQHRLLTPTVVAEIMAKTRCSVTVPPAEEKSDEITVWGNLKQGTDLSSALSTVLAKVNSQHTQAFLLPSSVARSTMTYINRTPGYMKSFHADHPKVSAYFPTKSQISSSSELSIDLVGEKEAIDAAVVALSGLVAKLVDGVREVEMDHLRHRLVQGKAGKKLKQYHDHEKVLIFFPEEKEESSAVLLIFDPTYTGTGTSAEDKIKRLDTVQTELLNFSKELGEFKSETITVETKWHAAILGKDRTTLNAIIGDDRTLTIKLGAEAEALSSQRGDDLIYIRGAVLDVDRAVEEIHRIVESAKNDEIDNSYVTEFEINREYVGRIVGSGGAGINKLRDSLGVKLDFIDDGDDREKDKDKEVTKKKKGASNPIPNQKSTVKIGGRKENVEEAKRRILNQVDRLADETSEVLKIPQQYHSSLIGASGKYVIRLEDKYAVKITFPRDGGDGDARTRESLKSDEVLVKGGKKGVAAAKSELMDALEFEKESNNTLQFNVPTKAVPRILGKGGATINDIKDSTDAQIDVDKGSNDQTKITLRGSKKAIAAAKTAILAISDVIGEEVSETVNIDRKHHRAIIGAGGADLKDMIKRCGGPEDSRSQAGLVHFPRNGEESNEIQLRGDRTVVKKLKAELEKIAASYRDRVVLAIAVPAIQHKTLIGRGGQHLKELQDRAHVQVQFPGSRSYASVGDAENISEVEGAEAADIVKVMGSRADCLKAMEELKSKIRTSGPTGSGSSQPSNFVAKVSVPFKYHHIINQQGNFGRQLRTMGIQLERSAHPTKSGGPTAPTPGSDHNARIDDEALTSQVQWQVVSNYQDAEDGSADWTLKARDQETLDKGQKHLDDAMKHAEQASHVGFLTLPNRSVFPRIVGTKGATVAKLRAETGADITVSKEDNTITIIGQESALEEAKAAILAIANNFGGRGHRGD